MHSGTELIALTTYPLIFEITSFIFHLCLPYYYHSLDGANSIFSIRMQFEFISCQAVIFSSIYLVFIEHLLNAQ